MPVFSENLRGVSPEEQREFEVTYPEDYERKQLRAAPLSSARPSKVSAARSFLDLNDEFAKDLGDFNTLDELKSTIRKSIFQEREHRA